MQPATRHPEQHSTATCIKPCTGPCTWHSHPALSLRSHLVKHQPVRTAMLLQASASTQARGACPQDEHIDLREQSWTMQGSFHIGLRIMHYHLYYRMRLHCASVQSTLLPETCQDLQRRQPACSHSPFGLTWFYACWWVLSGETDLAW